MKRAFTLVEVLTVVIILTILVVIALPNYSRLKKRIEYRETAGIVKLVQAGAKYYDLRYGIASLPSGDDVWAYLKVDRPFGANLIYTIEDESGTKYLRIKNADNDLLYSYQLPNGPGTKTEHEDIQYLPDDLPN